MGQPKKTKLLQYKVWNHIVSSDAAQMDWLTVYKSLKMMNQCEEVWVIICILMS